MEAVIRTARVVWSRWMMDEEWIESLPNGSCCCAIAKAATPWAFKNTDGRYMWANQAFERLVGYSLSELRVRRWQDITWHEDIGGEDASISDLVAGRTNSFSIEKQYRHKRGHRVSATCRTLRWPTDPDQPTECVIVEVIPCTMDDIKQVNSRLDIMERNMRQPERDDAGDKTVVNVGSSTVSNSDRAIQILGACVVAMALVLAWIAYYVFGRDGQAPPPGPLPSATSVARTAE